MAPLDLHIELQSVESLAMPTKNQKTAVHVVVHAEEAARGATCTADVAKGESSATWKNESLEVSVPADARRLRLEVRASRRSLTGRIKSEAIGAADVAVSDLVEGHVACDCPRLLSYRLRDRGGEDRGIVNFSVRVKGLEIGKWGRPPVVPESVDWRWRQPRPEGDGVVIGIPAAWYL